MEYVTKRLPVGILPVADEHYTDGLPFIVNVINHPVIAYPYPPTVLGTGYLAASRRPLIVGELFDVGNDPVKNFRRKAV